MFDVATCFVHSAISPSSYVSGNISVDDHIMPLCFVIGFCLRLSSLHQIMQYPKSGWLFLILHIFRKRLPQILSLNHWSSYLQSFRCPNKTVFENKFATIHISQHINIHIIKMSKIFQKSCKKIEPKISQDVTGALLVDDTLVLLLVAVVEVDVTVAHHKKWNRREKFIGINRHKQI